MFACVAVEQVHFEYVKVKVKVWTLETLCVERKAHVKVGPKLARTGVTRWGLP